MSGERRPSDRSPLVLIAGGGTGGHVFPALAAAAELESSGLRVEFAGTAAGFEARQVPSAGYVLHTLPVRGLAGKSAFARLTGLLRLGVALLQALWLIRRLRPAAALGVGGYASFPALAAAWLLRVPIVLHEQNAVPGIANRLLARVARVVAISYADSRCAFSGRVELIGNPVRKGFFAIAPVAPGQPLRLLVFGGSQGSRVLNQAVVEALPRLDPARFLIVHQTGPQEHAAIAAAYARSSFAGARVVSFLDDMPGEFAGADLVLCRSGATTSFELAAAGRPAVLVPFAAATGGHQELNARALERAGAAVVVLEGALDGDSLAAELSSLAAAPSKLVAMGEAARTLARPDAARDLARLVREQLRG